MNYLVGKWCSLAYVVTLGRANPVRGYKSWVFGLSLFFKFCCCCSKHQTCNSIILSKCICSADPYFPEGLCCKLDWGIRKYLQAYLFLIPKMSSWPALSVIKVICRTSMLSLIDFRIVSRKRCMISLAFMILRAPMYWCHFQIVYILLERQTS